LTFTAKPVRIYRKTLAADTFLSLADAEIHVGDAIRYEIAKGPLQEIYLINDLDIPNLDQETVTEN